MRGHKVTVSKEVKRGRDGGVAGASAAGASAASSPAVPKKFIMLWCPCAPYV